MEVDLSPGDFVLDWDPAPSPKGAEPLIFGPCLLWLNSFMDQDAKWYGGRPRPRRHCVRWGPSSTSPKGSGAHSPIFGPCLLWPNGWMDQDGTGMEVGLGSGHIVLDGNPATLPKNGQSRQFSAHFYCGETAGCIKMPLGMDVGFSPDDFVLNGDPASPPKKGRSPPPIFGQCPLWPNGWMD